MQNKKSEREIRIEKIQKMKDFDVIPFAQRYDKKDHIGDIKNKFESKKFREIEEIIKKPKDNISTAGRIMLHRSHGKILFMRLLDSAAQIQIMFHRDFCKIKSQANKNAIDELKNKDGEILSAYKFAEKLIDVGDFIGIQGEVFRTHKGELTIFASEFTFLSKAIRPLPEKFHGIQNQEAMYRQRYLDMIMNEETHKRFLFKSKFYDTLRSFYKSEGFFEIETSVLGNAASGAAATPFITRHNDYGCDFYLRIAFETALKKATVGRYEKVFEIGKDFRNEGSDPSHVQEFTQVEHYAVYRNYEDNMIFTEKMFDYIFENIGIDRKIKVKDKAGVEKEVDFSTPFERIDYTEGVNKVSGLDISQYGMDDADKLRKEILAKGHKFEGIENMGTTTLIDNLYKKVLRPDILGPAFIYNYPKIMQPLARISDDDPTTVEQFQLLVNGWEICKAYGELVDPLLQQANFDEQSEVVAAGDDEATAEDHDFVLSMEHGMPPQSGFGMGLERILAILTQQDNLRDVIMFPLMKSVEPNINCHSGLDPESPQTTRDPETSSGGQKKKLKSHFDNKTTISENIDMYEEIPHIDDAHKLVDKYLTDTKDHCYQVAKVMKYFAHKIGANEELRYLVGLLHDIDRDYIGKDPAKHLQGEFEQIMGEIKASKLLIDDIRSHYEEGTGVEVNSLIRKYLAATDELTAFVFTVSLMRPTGLEGMKAKSITKKIKDKKFAAGVSREHLKNCERYLDILFAEFVMDVIEALKG